MSYSYDTKSDKVTTVHSAIGASVASAGTTPVDCTGYNAVLMYVTLSATGSPNWTVALESSDAIDGTFAASYDGTLATDKLLTTGALTANRTILFKGIGNYVKAVPTENSGTGTCTVKLQPVNI